MFGLIFNRYNKLHDIFDRKLQQLFVAGMIEHYDTEYNELVNPKRYEHLQEPPGPKILTMEHLEAGFVVWLVSVCVAVLALIFEWITKFKEYFITKHILCAFYKERSMNGMRVHVKIYELIRQENDELEVISIE